MSNRKFLAKLCLASFLFGGNCNANPPKIVLTVWGNVGKQSCVPNYDIPMQSIDEKGSLLDSNIDVSSRQTLKELEYIVLEITNINDGRSVLAKLCTITDKGSLGIEGKPEYKKLSAVNGCHDDENNCCICLDELYGAKNNYFTCFKKTFNVRDNVCVKLSVENEKNCNHLFHSNCILTWFEEAIACPMDKLETKKIYFLLEKNERENEEIIGVANEFANKIAEKINGSLIESVELKDFRKNLRKKQCKRRLKLVSVITIFVLFLIFVLLHLFGSNKQMIAEPKKSLPEEEKIRCGVEEFFGINHLYHDYLHSVEKTREKKRGEEILKLKHIMKSENITHASPKDPRFSEVDFEILNGDYDNKARLEKLRDILIEYRYPKEFVTNFLNDEHNIAHVHVHDCSRLVESFFGELEKHDIAENCFNYTEMLNKK